MPGTLAAFSDRFDRRWREEARFGFVLRRAPHGEPLPYSRLVAEAVGSAGRAVMTNPTGDLSLERP